jgi:ArsR family transcriptional regulator
MASTRCTPVPQIDERDFSSSADFMKALGDAHRLTIVATLLAANEPVCVCDFVAALPINQSSVSHHLGLLREAGIVVSERKGTWAYYRIAPDFGERVREIVGVLAPAKRLRKAS